MANNENKTEQNSEFARNTPFRSSRAQLTPAALEKYIPLINCNAATYESLCTEGKLIADKTPFLRELCKSTQFIRITLPRRMGKTMLLTMAKAFFEMPDGEKYEKPEKSPNYELFKDSLIFEDKAFVAKRFGKHPTIYLSLHGVTGTTFFEYKEQLASAIRKAYEKFKYVQDKFRRGYLEELQFFKDVRQSGSKSLTEINLRDSIEKLSAFLHEIYGQKVVILIDEYDMPMKVISQTMAISKAERSKIMNFHNAFLWESFKTNEHIYKGVVAGIMRVRVTGPDPKSDLTFDECNLATANSFSRFFGFSEALVDELREKMATDFKITISDDHLKMAKQWYNGFTFEANNKSEFFYNPYSMSCFFAKYQDLGINALQYYWSLQTSTIDFVAGVLKRKEIASQLDKLLDPHPQNAEYLNVFSISKLEKEFTMKSYEQLEKLGRKSAGIESDGIKLVFSFLFYMGYINFKKERAVVPNEESRIFLRQQLRVYYKKKYAFDADLATAVTDEFVNLVEMQESENKMMTKNLNLPIGTILEEDDVELEHEN